MKRTNVTLTFEQILLMKEVISGLIDGIDEILPGSYKTDFVNMRLTEDEKCDLEELQMIFD